MGFGVQYYNQIITLVLEALDDPEATIRELAAAVMLEMLKNQVCHNPGLIVVSPSFT